MQEFGGALSQGHGIRNRSRTRLRAPDSQAASRMRASSPVTPKQVMMGWSWLDTMPNSTGLALSTMGQAWICFTAASGTLEKNRSEILRSKTISSLSRESRPENMPTAPCRIVTTVSMAATLKAIPAMLMSVRMRWRPRLVRINRRKIMMPE